MSNTSTAVFLEHLRVGSRLFHAAVNGLSYEEVHRRAGLTAGSMLWIAGHVLVYRSRMLQAAGLTFDCPWVSLFSRGATLLSPAEYPDMDEIVRFFDDLTARLNTAIGSLDESALERETEIRTPVPDRTTRGVIAFLIYHEAYHVGQMALIRKILGYPGIIG